MKKILISCGLFIALSLAACGGIDSKIERLNELEKKIEQLSDDPEGNAAELSKLIDEDNQIRQELSKEKLTPEQEKNFDKAKFGKL